jgi:hypothetical protein
MNDFVGKWRKATMRARPELPGEAVAPYGFAARVVALFVRPGRAAAEPAWDRLMLRLLAGAIGVLVVCLALEMPHWGDDRPLEPGIENAVAQVIWSL